MALSAFTDGSAPPQPEEVAAALGAASGRWDEVRRQIAARLASLTEQWGFTSKSTGWGLRLKQGDRIIAYLAPQVGHFRVSFVLGEKAVRAAHASGLPAPVLALIDSSRKYAEGRGVRFEVRSDDDVRAAVDLAVIKSTN